MDVICTIATTNYISRAMTLAKSCRVRHPEIPFVLVVTDSESLTLKELSKDFDIQITFASNYLSKSEESDFRGRYDVVEFCTALKPYVLKSLLDQGFQTATYLDPDIKLYGKLTEGLTMASLHGIALTPHRLMPGPWEDFQAQEVLLLKYGVYNLGFISVSKKAYAFLNWWKRRTQKFCTRHPADPVFTDQKWLDLATTYFSFGKITHRGFNVGPWNLDERKLKRNNEVYYCENDELVFFHFSQLNFGEYLDDNCSKMNLQGILSAEKQIYSDYALDVEKINHNLNKYDLNSTLTFSQDSNLVRFVKRDFSETRKELWIIILFLRFLEKILKLEKFRWWNFGTYGFLVDCARYLERRK